MQCTNARVVYTRNIVRIYFRKTNLLKTCPLMHETYASLCLREKRRIESFQYPKNCVSHKSLRDIMVVGVIIPPSHYSSE